MIRLDEIKIYEDLDESDVIRTALRKSKVAESDVVSARIVKKSIDARNKSDVHYSFSLDIEVDDENKYPKLRHFEYPKDEVIVSRQSKYRPVIVGSGPAGLFCALELVDHGVKPIIIEQGAPVEERICDVERIRMRGGVNPRSNVQFGEGGAGTFSDGKLTTGVNSPLIKKVLERFYEFGAPKEVTYLAKPHVGTDVLVDVVRNMRKYIESKGGTYLFHTKFVDFSVIKNAVSDGLNDTGAIIKAVTDNGEFETDSLVLAIGHSASDTFELLKRKNVQMERKVFAVGLRIEHKQKMIDESQYGSKTKLKLPPAEYKLVYHGDRSCYSFCMCPGGEVIASSSEEGAIVTNGMSKSDRAGANANAALLVNVVPEDFPGNNPLEGMYFQRELERKAFTLGGSNYNAPVQRVEDFEKGCKSDHIGSVVPTYKPGYTLSDLNEILPSFVGRTIKEALPYFDRKIKGYNNPDAILTGVETRSSSPVTIVRGQNMQSSVPGIYPAGEGAGYAGGITTAAIDGIKIARIILENNG